MMIGNKYRRKVDGKIAEPYALFNIMPTEPYKSLDFIKKYYVVFGEPKNIQQEEVDDTDKWELLESFELPITITKQ